VAEIGQELDKLMGQVLVQLRVGRHATRPSPCEFRPEFNVAQVRRVDFRPQNALTEKVAPVMH
jgi:hypothetical protein